MKTSVFIPCVPEHWWNLPLIIKIYETGMIKPDEIVVLLSDCERLEKMFEYREDLPLHPKENLSDVAKNLKVYKHKEKMSCGYARSFTKKYCTGDIILQQDADDYPDRNRVEVVKDFYENHKDTDLLLHSYVFVGEKKEDVKQAVVGNDIIKRGKGSFNVPFRMHDGAHVVKREFLNKCDYTHENKFIGGSDHRFVRRALEQGKVMAISTPLYVWFCGSSDYVGALVDKTMKQEKTCRA